jgi:hypothetical protein
MDEGLEVTNRAMRVVQRHLETLVKSGKVVPVDEDPSWQGRGVDILWYREDHSEATAVEVKGDRWHRTGNFFLETSSNVERNTPGCFVSTDSDIFAYYFVDAHELHLLPTKVLQKWFSEHIDQFPERLTGTRIHGRIAYHTAGRLVPRQLVRAAFPDYPIVMISDFE